MERLWNQGTLLSVASRQSEDTLKPDSAGSRPCSTTGSGFQRRRTSVINESFSSIIKSFSLSELPAGPLHFSICHHQKYRTNSMGRIREMCYSSTGKLNTLHVTRSTQYLYIYIMPLHLLNN